MHQAEESVHDQRTPTTTILHFVYKKYTCTSSNFLCSYLFSLVLPNVFKSTFCHGIWPKSQQDNHNCSTHTVMGQVRSKGAIRWEEMTEVCQELARQHDQKAGGKAAFPPNQEVWAEAVTPPELQLWRRLQLLHAPKPSFSQSPRTQRQHINYIYVYRSPRMTW